jgi:plasmid stabilization system protein ParE
MAELVFLLSADIDIQRAYEFYENYQIGRGVLFMQHLDVAFSHLRQFPEIGPTFHGDYRRLLIPGFPYGIFYTIEGARIIVAWVMDLCQDPEAIMHRLAG